MARTFKRPFQPSIGSYFGRLSNDADCPVTPTSSPPSILVPTLPSTIQSSLLNVGMRIRKSVPEGYKTKRKMADSAAIAPGGSSTAEDMNTSDRPSPQGYTGLVPYCGILKVGGYAAQPIPVPTEEDLPPLHFDDDQWSSSFPSSQESNTSSVASVVTSKPEFLPSIKKRRREEADDENLGLESQPVSPRTRPIR